MVRRFLIASLVTLLSSMGCGGGDDSAGAETGSGGAISGSGGAGTTGGAPGGAGGSANAGSGGAETGGAAVGDGGSSGGSTSGGGGVRFVGRFDTSDASRMGFAWSGSRILANFSGTEVGVKLDDAGQNYFDVLVDGVVQKDKLHPSAGMGEYPLATGLADGTHSVEVYRLTEANQGDTYFLGFTLGAGGKMLDPAAGPARGIEMVGDSITCGYGDEGANMDCHFSPDTENHYVSYGAITGRNLDADVVTIAWSGKGVVYNYGTDEVEPLPDLYDRILPLAPTPIWDFTKWTPDAVVINLGTNDFSTDGDPTEELFNAKYAAFLGHIRGKYPNAFIICLCAPLMTGADYDTVAGFEGKVVSDMNAAGDTKVKFVDLRTDNTGWGCDWHPSIATHAAMAVKLTAEIKADLGW